MTVHNFGPGPAVLPDSVKLEVKEAITNFHGTGIGILEISHRSKHFEQVITLAEERIRRLLSIPSEYAVMFCHGGATMQFSMVPLNLGQGYQELPEYLLSGVWAVKAFEEAQRLVGANENGSSSADKFRSLPQILPVREGAPYLHYTSNNTIYGTQWWPQPQAAVPLVCDASSDLFSRPLDITTHAAVYSCAQKNFGCAGLTIAIIRRDLIERAPSNLPVLLAYRTYEKHQSLYNTPATFPIYVAERYLAWIEEQGGVTEMERRSRSRAELVYRCIDENPLYQPYAASAYRSLMNATFTLPTHECEKKFLSEAESAGMVGLKGHKLLGGIRASLYNALSHDAVVDLVTFMTDFAKRWDS
jgi:phosphoserine aminotransferase